jgi:hypothetical protein
MDAVHVSRLQARYRLPAGSPEARARLDRVLREVLDGALEDALERSGVAAGEEVCLRHVDASTRLSLGEADGALASAWGAALAEAIRATLAAGGPGVVRYRSRSQALVDLLVSVAAGDLRRSWAWRQLGTWSAGESPSAAAAAEEAGRVLLRHPAEAPAALAAAARAGALPALAARVPVVLWTLLARAALAASIGDEAAAALLAAAADASPSPQALDSPATTIIAERAVRASAIARAAFTPFTSSPQVVRSLAVLALLETEPAALRRPPPEAAAVLRHVEREMGIAPSPERPAGPAADEREPAVAERTERRAEVSSDFDRPRTGEEAVAPAEAGEDEERPLPSVRAEGETRWGGLLFLVHLVGELGLPEEIDADEALAARPFRWVLHRLALQLLALDERDPAALAFCGLGPDRDPPSRGEPPVDDEEQARIGELARRVARALHERVRGEEAPDARAAAALLREVGRRTAVVLADPGWIDVRLMLDEVTTEVRRAGLDLDPGWVPWLGVAVRFVYE